MTQTIEKPTQASTRFTSQIPWQNLEPDCLVICCSDHRFEAQTREFLKHLGYHRPHMLQIPSGPVLTLPLAVAGGFLSKAMDKVIEKIVELKRVKTIIAIGHQDCGAYKAGHVHLVNVATRELTGKTVVDLQKDHLAKAAKRMRYVSSDLKIQSFFARVISEGEKARVTFEEIPVK